MKSYIRKIPLLLIVVLLGVITFGCSKISNNNFPMDFAEIQKAIEERMSANKKKQTKENVSEE